MQSGIESRRIPSRPCPKRPRANNGFLVLRRESTLTGTHGGVGSFLMRPEMSFSTDRRETRWHGVRAIFSGVCLAIPLLFACSEKAAASCGDWLAHPAAAHPMTANQPTEAEASVDTVTLADAMRHDQIPTRPCNGPGCRGGVPVPFPSAATLSIPSPQDYCCHSAADQSICFELVEFLVPNAFLCELPRPLHRIDRPPQV